MNFLNEFLSRLPSPINRTGQNVVKLARFITEPLDEAKSLYENVEAFRSIDSATGKALDALGEKYGQKRGQADDAFYRVAIRSKIITRSGNTTVNGILQSISVSLGVSPTGIAINPLRASPSGNGEPLAITLKNIPFDVARTEWEKSYLQDRIRGSVAVGVRVAEIQYVITSTLNAGAYFVGGIALVDTITTTNDWRGEATQTAAANSSGAITFMEQHQLTNDWQQSTDSTGVASEIGAITSFDQVTVTNDWCDGVQLSGEADAGGILSGLSVVELRSE